ACGVMDMDLALRWSTAAPPNPKMERFWHCTRRVWPDPPVRCGIEERETGAAKPPGMASAREVGLGAVRFDRFRQPAQGMHVSGGAQRNLLGLGNAPDAPAFFFHDGLEPAVYFFQGPVIALTVLDPFEI